MTRQIVVGIPVRMASTRYPGKPLADIDGMPMVEHVWRRCRLSSAVTRLVVAGCDVEIARWAQNIGAEYVHTDPEISRPSLRVAAALQDAPLHDNDLVVVVQGDEPLVHPSMIEDAILPLSDPGVFATNLCAEATAKDLMDPAEIKVVHDLDFNAMYMSRSPIPNASHADSLSWKPMRQVCIFGFRHPGLQAMAYEIPATPLEQYESIEMNRLLEYGATVRMVPTDRQTKSVDTPDDRAQAEGLIREDPLTKMYAGPL